MPDSKIAASADTPVTDQIVIGYRRKLTAQGLDDARKQIARLLDKLHGHGVTELDSYVAAGSSDKVSFAVSLVRLDKPDFRLADLQKLAGSSEYEAIDFCERNAQVSTLAVQPAGLRTVTAFDDPLAFDQWALATLGATDSWKITPPAGKTILAIVDSGLRRFDGSVHADLAQPMAVPACHPPPYVDGIDREGHGTRLAGTIAALVDNRIGVASAVPANWGITLLPIKFFDAGEPATAYYAAIAITCAADQGAKVVNASWHVAPADSNLQGLRSAIDYAVSKGCLVVAAAGNSGSNNEIYPTYPANFGAQPAFAGKGMLTVMATDRQDYKPWFSNYGPNTVHIAAPGVDIMTTGPYLADPPRYQFYSGTSAAAAFVSAGAALTFALNPKWTPREVIDHLTASADIVSGLRLACIRGRRLNLHAAVYGPLAVEAPCAGEVLQVGRQITIGWKNRYTNPNFTDVEISFSKDGGLTWRVLVASTPNNGRYKWRPDEGQVTNKARLRIKPLTGNYPVQSDVFKIRLA
jgi:hypothetical protein